MHIPVIYNENGITGDDALFFDHIGLGNEKRSSSIFLCLSVIEGDNALPVLHFFDTNTNNPGREAEKVFFSKIVKPPFRLFAFTDLPLDQAKVFHNSYFQDSTNVYKIKCTIQPNIEGAETTPYRWLEFTRETENPVGVYPNSLIKLEFLNKDDKPYLNRAYIDPMLASGNLSVSSFFQSHFDNKHRFPIALPPKKEVSNNTYFGNYTISGSVQDFASDDGDDATKPPATRYFIPAVRKAFRDIILSSEGVKKNSLFVRLWEMADDPSLTEFLKDGSFFTFHAFDYENQQKQSQELGGKPSVTFHYANPDLYQGNTLKKWKTQLLEVDYRHEDGVEAIKQAVFSDIKSAIPGVEQQISKADKAVNNGWEEFSFPLFDTENPRVTDYFTKIQSISWQTDNKDIQSFIKEHILDPSEARGNIPHDHSLALDRFSEFLCRFPFESVAYESYSDEDETDFKSEWQLFLMDFIEAKGNLSPKSLDPAIDINTDKCIYSASLSPREIFRLRLMLPADADLESSFTSVLNYNNALNYNFVL